MPHPPFLLPGTPLVFVSLPYIIHIFICTTLLHAITLYSTKVPYMLYDYQYPSTTLNTRYYDVPRARKSIIVTLQAIT